MSDISFYTLRMIGEDQYYLSLPEGDRLSVILLNASNAAPFVEIEDISGSPLVVQKMEVQSLYASTPETREQDVNGPLAEIRKALSADLRASKRPEWEAGEDDE